MSQNKISRRARIRKIEQRTHGQKFEVEIICAGYNWYNRKMAQVRFDVSNLICMTCRRLDHNIRVCGVWRAGVTQKHKLLSIDFSWFVCCAFVCCLLRWDHTLRRYAMRTYVLHFIGTILMNHDFYGALYHCDVQSSVRFVRYIAHEIQYLSIYRTYSIHSV